MKQLSSVRLGVCLGLIPDVALDTLNRLTIQLQSAHLRAGESSIESDDDERAARARVARTILGEQ
jgi:protein-arginine kinase